MLIIKPAQYAALRALQLDGSVQRQIERLRSRHASRLAALSEEQVRKIALTGIERAGEYEFRTEGQVAFYLELMLDFGPDFDVQATTAWAGEILNDDSLTPPQKMTRLDEVRTFVPKEH